ncbi:MAG: XdhC family protein [Caulobacteraceae bacterium]
MREALESGRPAALATIVALSGGGPRPVGTQMVMAPEPLAGFLSGGCLEADVAGHGALVLEEGQPRRLIYGQGSPWPDIRLLCGARIEILLERIDPGDEAARRLFALMDARVPAVWIGDGSRRLCAPLTDDPAAWPGAFRRIHPPAPRLIVLGGDPTALAIAALGAGAGCQTTLVRPKGSAEPPPLAGVAYSRDDPATALGTIGLDAWTAVAVATHDAELDHAALVAALPSTAFYVGALGARRRAPDRREGLRRAGIGQRDLDRLHAPIGLDIGGKAPWEVAIAVMAQITALRRALAGA